MLYICIPIIHQFPFTVNFINAECLMLNAKYLKQTPLWRPSLFSIRHHSTVVVRTEVARVPEPQVFRERKLEDLGAVGSL
jgi:hypothetical protein